MGPSLNPQAAAFVPTFGNDLASWAQGRTDKAASGNTSQSNVRGPASGRDGRSSPFAAAAAPPPSLPAINTNALSSDANGGDAGGRVDDRTRPPPLGPTSSKPAPVSTARPQPVATHAQALSASSLGAAARLVGRQESWSASHTRRAIGSDSGDLDFDDLFQGGGLGGSAPSQDALEAASSLESPSALQASAAAAANLATAQSVEDALAGGGMVATSYVDVDAAAPAAVSAVADGAAADSVSPRTPAAVRIAPGHGLGNEVPMSPSKVSPADFEVLKVVGQGAFGKVFQVRKRDGGRIYAMKVMRKDRILARDHSEYVRAERDVLTSVRHPYIVGLHWSFQTASKLYLVLDFVNGGHLFFNLYRAGIFDEAQARLYTAEIVAAIAHLHSLDIVHRDLKPENVLLDAEGHIRITDFGLAKAVPAGERSNSLIGTMEYMAPEVINAKGHDRGVDWWSVGILLYEMLCGVTPFRQKDKAKLRRMITCDKLKFTKNADGYLSGEAKSLVRALLEKDPSRRLGSGPAGADAIRRHPFFRSIVWSQLDTRQIPSPYCPRTTGIEDVDNFDKLWTDRTPEDSPVGTPVNGTPLGNSFRGFTYVAPSFLAGNSRGSSPAKAGLLAGSSPSRNGALAAS